MNNEKKIRAKRKVAPQHAVTVRAFAFPIITNDIQSQKFVQHCHFCCELRNKFVNDRNDNRLKIKAQKLNGETPDKYINRADQYAVIPGLLKENIKFRAIHSQVMQNVAERVDKGYKAFLSHIKKKTPGKKSPPGIVEAKDYKSFSFPQYGSAAFIKSGTLCLSKLGDFKLRDYKKLQGKPKSITIKFDEGMWWAIIFCEMRIQDVYRSAADVGNLKDNGGDPGLSALLTLADGTIYDPPKALKDMLSKLRSAQKDMSRKFEMRKKNYKIEQERRKLNNEEPLPALRDIAYSGRLKKNIKRVAKLHTQVKHIREHHHKKLARRLEKTVRCLVMEEHSVKFMIRNRKQARAASDRGIYSFKQAAKSTLGMRYIPTGTVRAGIGGNSQTCLCNAPVPKDLNERMHNCPNCGLIAHRDVVSANIAMLSELGYSILKIPDPSKFIEQKDLEKYNEAQKLSNKINKVNKKINTENVVGEAGHANHDCKVRIRGEIKDATGNFGECRVDNTSETSMKREPVLPKGCKTEGDDSTSLAKTSCVLESEKLTTKNLILPSEANMHLPALPASGSDCNGKWSVSGSGKHRPSGR